MIVTEYNPLFKLVFIVYYSNNFSLNVNNNLNDPYNNNVFSIIIQFLNGRNSHPTFEQTRGGTTDTLLLCIKGFDIIQNVINKQTLFIVSRIYSIK